MCSQAQLIHNDGPSSNRKHWFFLSWMRQLLKPSFSKNFPRFPYQFCLLIIIPMVDTLYEESVLPRNLTQNVGDCSPPSEDKCWLLEYPTSCRQYFKYRHKKYKIQNMAIMVKSFTEQRLNSEYVSAQWTIAFSTYSISRWSILASGSPSAGITLKQNNRAVLFVYHETKPKQSLRPNTKNTDNPVNQSRFETTTRSWRKARENVRAWATIGFGFTSDWLRKWHVFPESAQRTYHRPWRPRSSSTARIPRGSLMYKQKKHVSKKAFVKWCSGLMQALSLTLIPEGPSRPGIPACPSSP